MNNIIAFLFVGGLLSFAACVKLKPVRMTTDPNLDRQQRIEEKIDQSNATAFIAEHPELDEQTKKELRDGTLTTHEAGERLEKQRARRKPVP